MADHGQRGGAREGVLLEIDGEIERQVPDRHAIRLRMGVRVGPDRSRPRPLGALAANQRERRPTATDGEHPQHDETHLVLIARTTTA